MSDWDGTDRRKDDMEIRERLVRIEERVININKRINGSVDDIRNHIEQGSRWRVVIASMVAMFLLSIISGIYAYGKLCSIVEDNTKEIQLLRK